MTRSCFISRILRNRVSPSSIIPVKQIHALILTGGLISDVTISTDLLLAYCRCARVKHARNVFDEMTERNMHSWNILISSYIQHSLFSDAMHAFLEFLKSGLRPDHYTLPAALRACTGTGCFGLGRNLHSLVVRIGFEGNVVVGSSLLDFYLKFGDVAGARRVFTDMSYKDLVVWKMVISGFERAGCYVEALECFTSMTTETNELDNMTIPSVLGACGGAADLIKGKEIHGKLVKSLAFCSDIAIENALIDMYSRSGCLNYSENVFAYMRERNLVTWTTMISCYGHHGKGNEAVNLFEKMQEYEHKPNSVTITAILYSCNHSGLIDQGELIFISMKQKYGFEPSMEHYACMVDLLGRCGRLNEAFELVRKMKVAPAASIWGALLASCVMHKNVRIAEIAANHLFILEPRNSSNYIALCSIYDSLGISDGVSRIRGKMRSLGLVKTPGCSWITDVGKIQKFYQGDFSHPLAKLIRETLEALTETMILHNQIMKQSS